MNDATHHAAGLSGEHRDHKVAVTCASRQTAEQIAADLCAHTSLSQSQVTVIRPGEPHEGRELEPESRGIWHTMIRAHIGLGLVGVGVGLVLFLVMHAVGIPFVTQNPWWSGALFLGFGGVLGLMLGGAFTLRPDHMPYLMKAQSSLRSGKYVVAVHAESLSQLHEAQEEFEKRGLSSVRTL